MRELTGAEIEALAARPKVRRIAVENFLGTLHGLTAMEATLNLAQDTAAYKWNAPTVAAIRAGIRLAEEGPR